MNKKVVYFSWGLITVVSIAVNFILWFWDNQAKEDLIKKNNESIWVNKHNGLQLKSCRQIAFDWGNYVALDLEFNHRVKMNELKKYLQITNPVTGEKILCDSQSYTNRNNAYVYFKYPNCQQIRISLKKGLYDRTRKYYLKQTQQQSVRIENAFKISSITPTTYGKNTFIELSCNQPAPLDELKKSITIKPELPFHIKEEYRTYKIIGDFQPGIDYQIEISKTLPPLYGTKLRNDIAKTLKFNDYPSYVQFKSNGIYMAKKGHMNLAVEIINCKNVFLTIYPIYPNNLVYFLRDEFPRNYSAETIKKVLKPSLKNNELVVQAVDLKTILEEKKSGVYQIHASSTNSDYYYRYDFHNDQRLIMLTDIGISAKRLQDELLVWVTSLKQAEPLNQAKVSLVTAKNQVVASTYSDANGIARFKTLSRNPEDAPYIILVENKDDFNFLKFQNSNIPLNSFKVSGRPYNATAYDAFVYSDRGVYRPGETIHIQGIVRQKGMAYPEQFPINMVILKPDLRVFKTKSAIIQKNGMINYDFDIPVNAPTGIYRFEICLPDSNTAIGNCRFQVEDFMPDRLNVDVAAENKEFSPGDVIDYTVQANHLFGKPASNCWVKGYCRLYARSFKPTTWQQYRFDNSKTLFEPKTFKMSSKKTDEQGKCHYQMTIPTETNPPSMLAFCMVASVFDIDNRAVSAYKQNFIYPYKNYVGLSRYMQESAQVNHEETFNYCLINPDSSSVKSDILKQMKLKVEMYKNSWNWVLKVNQNDRYEYVSSYREFKFKEIVLKPTEATGSFTFTPDEACDYRIVVTNEYSGQSADISFSCTGISYSWAKSNPDHLDISCHKEKYGLLDQVKLSIKSPVQGLGLVTVESDKIHDTFTYQQTDLNSEFSFPVKDEYGSHFYCSVSVISPVNDYAKPLQVVRAIGVIPIEVDYSHKKLDLSATCPDIIEPMQSLNLAITCLDHLKKPCQADLTVALVDEGICQLTNFQTPDPLSYFYGKRVLRSETYDMYSMLMPEFKSFLPFAKANPGGGAGINAKFLNPISSKRVENAVLWQSGIKTDKDGKAAVSFTMPNFNGKLRVMVMAAQEDSFANLSKSVTVREPLMIKPSAPRFLAPDDRISIPVAVFNQSGQSGKLTVTTDFAGQHLEQSAKLAKDEEKVFCFALNAPQTPGAYQLSFNAKLEDKQQVLHTKKTIQLPVRPPCSFTVKSKSGKLDAAAGNHTIELPQGWLPGTRQTTMILSSYPNIKLSGSLKYLLNYPYGCLEQTTSRCFPLLYMNDLLQIVEPKLCDQQRINQYIQAGIDRILAMQIYNGGFALWPGSHHAFPWGTAYAGQFLVEAKKKGFNIPDSCITNMLRYMSKYVTGSNSNDQAKIYMLYVMALAGKGNQSMAISYLEHHKELDPYSTCQLAMTLSLLKEHDKAKKLLPIDLEHVSKNVPDNANLNSLTRQYAIILLTFLELNPDQKVVEQLVEQIGLQIDNGCWYSTQENAYALMALGKYYHCLKKGKETFKAQVYSGNKQLGECDGNKVLTLTPRNIADGKIQIKSQGTGDIYYFYQVEGVLQNYKSIVERDENLSVRKCYLTTDGKPINLSELVQGDMYTIEISLKSNVRANDIVVSDLLPAGLEIENQRLSTRDRYCQTLTGNLDPDFVEPRDDRFLIFCSNIGAIPKTFYYTVRAVTQGEYLVPPISAVSMYKPNLKSVSGKVAKMVVKARE